MNVLNVVKRRKQYKSKLSERIAAKNGTQFENLRFSRWVTKDQLLLVKEINEVAERVESCSSDNYNNFSWFSVSQLQSLSF
mgnify:FL=1